ncbi:MAG: hypothetical protein MPJ50_09925 [Pirellulales bacterium]|nr:hypothetical protein [Pirellulales bacterium]
MRCVKLFAIANGILLAGLLSANAVAEEPFRAPATPSSYFQDPPAPAPVVDGGNTGPQTAGQQVYGDFISACNTCVGCGFYGGVESTNLVAFSEPDQQVVLTDLLTGQQFTGTSSPGLGTGVRTWVGIQRCGWGTRATYWHFEEDTVNVDPIAANFAAPAFTQFNEIYHLNMDVVDLEFTQEIACNCWTFNSSIGGRYADIEREAKVVGIGRLGGGTDLLGLAVGSNEIEGAGITFSIGASRPLYHRCGWNFFWNYRGSYLYTDYSASSLTQADAFRTAPMVNATAIARNAAFAAANNDEGVYVSEAQIGLQYERQLCCVPALFFCKIAVEYQHWDTGDAFAQSTSFAQVQGVPGPYGARVDSTSVAHDGDLDLIGFTIGSGFTY